MYRSLIHKELRAIILSPKFTHTFIICSLLLLLSTFIGIQEYRQSVSQYDTAVKLAEQRLNEQSSWHAIRDRVYRKPDPMQVFVSGLSYDIGRWSDIGEMSTTKLKNSTYSDDPIFAVFRFLDFTFIVQIIFSLFAILFTYDAICGEREQGTLRLVFSNAVPRTTYILSKCIGSWLGLVVPLMIPILLSFLMVSIYGIPISWAKIGLMNLLSLLYISLFIVLGVFVSSLTKRSSVSFLFSLVLWIAFVLIIPRAGVLAASQFVNVPRLAEVEGMRDGYAKNAWAQYAKDTESRWNDFNRSQGNDNAEDDSEINEEALWARMMFEDSARKVVQQDIEAYESQLMADWNRSKRVQQKLGFTLSRFSPASSFQLAASTLASADIDMKSRYEQAMNTYRRDFNSFIEDKQAESGQVGGVMITIDSEKGMSIGGSRDNAGLDLTGRPEFVHPDHRLGDIVSSVVVDMGLLAFGILLLFSGVYARFMRYDLR